MHARAVMAISGGYTGARRNRKATQTWQTGGNSPDADILPDLALLRERSRDLVRNAPIAGGAVGTVVQNVIGTGLSLQSRPDHKALGMSEDEASEWAATTEREFRLWSESVDCDITRTQNFYGLQDLAFRAALESGDVFALLLFAKPNTRTPYRLRVQVLEADRVANPSGKRDNEGQLAGGIEFAPTGEPLAYHFLKHHPGAILSAAKQETVRIAAFGARTGRRNVIHLFDRTRPGQSRGVPFLAPVIEPLKQLDRYTEAEVSAAVVSSLFTVFVKTENGNGLASDAGTTVTSAEAGEEVRLGSGAILDLMPGEDVTFANPSRPNTAFDVFTLAVLRQIGAALGLPFEVLVKHFTSSYSASRAAMLDAFRFFRGRRSFVGAGFCDPVYSAWMEEAVSIGRIVAPGFFGDPVLRAAYLRTEWIGDSPGHVDPMKEVQASQMLVDGGFSSRQIETMRLIGRPWEEVHEQQVRERQRRAADGLISPPDAPVQEDPPPDPDEEAA